MACSTSSCLRIFIRGKKLLPGRLPRGVHPLSVGVNCTQHGGDVRAAGRAAASRGKRGAPLLPGVRASESGDQFMTSCVKQVELEPLDLSGRGG